MKTNQSNMTINQVFDELFEFPENITQEQRKEIKNLFVTYLVKSNRDISTPEKLKYELNVLAREKAAYIKQAAGISVNLSFDEFKEILNNLLSSNDFSGLDEDFKPINDIFKNRVKDSAISAFDVKRPQIYADDSEPVKKQSRFKLYISEKIEKFKDIPPKEFRRHLIRIGAGVSLVCVMVSSIAGVKYGIDFERQNQQNNVCVEYRVQDGEGNIDLDEIFYEYGYTEYAVSGASRNLSPNKGNPFLGDVIVGRTTKEIADKLVAEGKARIISIEEATELLGKNHTLIGEFKRAAEENSNIVFYVPVNGKTLG